MISVVRPAVVGRSTHGLRRLLPCLDPAATLPVGQGGLATASALDRIFTFVGFTDNVADELHTVQAYNPTSGRWRVQAPMPTARGDAAVNTVEVCNTRTGSWSRAGSDADARGNLRAVRRGNGIHAVGGADTDGLPTAAVEAHSPQRNIWTAAALLLLPREE